MWEMQLESIRQVSSQIAKAVTRKYPTLQKLIKEYRKCKSIQEAENLLAELTV